TAAIDGHRACAARPWRMLRHHHGGPAARRKSRTARGAEPKSWKTWVMASAANEGLAEGGSLSLRRGTASDLQLRVIATPGFPDYGLLDRGEGRKLERLGRFTVERPESQALWGPVLEPGAWLRADATFKASGADDEGDGGRWRTNTAVPETWPVRV